MGKLIRPSFVSVVNFSRCSLPLLRESETKLLLHSVCSEASETGCGHALMGALEGISEKERGGEKKIESCLCCDRVLHCFVSFGIPTHGCDHGDDVCECEVETCRTRSVSTALFRRQLVFLLLPGV